MQLKEYQTICLDKLREYLASVKEYEASEPRYAARAAWGATHYAGTRRRNGSSSERYVNQETLTKYDVEFSQLPYEVYRRIEEE